MLYPDLTVPPPRPAEGFYTSEVFQDDELPVHTFLPTGYEPGYQYPLLVFFHGNGSDEERILQLAPRMSRRNFIGISIRAPHPVIAHPGDRLGYSWGADDASDAQLEDYVFAAIEQTCEYVNIHPRRIYLAGVWEGAALAFRIGLLFPEKFAGVISLNGTMTRRRRPLLRLPEIRQLRIFMAHGIANALIPMSMGRADAKLLYTAGLDVAFRTYPTNHRLHSDMLSDVNRWVVDNCERGFSAFLTR